jgi:hypothetical protein
MSQKEVTSDSQPLEPDAAKEKFGFGASWLPLMLALPPLVYYMWICMVDHGGAFYIPTSIDELLALVKRVPAPTRASTLFVVLWFGGQALLQIYAPGDWVQGSPLPDGKRLKYKMNGWFSFWLTILGLFFCCWMGWIPATFLWDEFGPIMTSINLLTYVLCLYLYFKGKASPEQAYTGRVMYDYFMGTELNPRVGNFDIKLFCEARPGLTLWVLINFSIAAKQWQLHHSVSTPMMLVSLFHFFYIMDYYFHEEAILTTWDIKHEKFGWMLCWGDLVWVPFTYTLQAQYLLTHTGELPLWATLGIIALNLAGYAVFRGTNIQKHHFSRNPDHLIWGRPATFIQTVRGTKLLTSGFWGIARHLNYCGDLMMALAWCLTCGVHNLLPYFYIIYFTWLLVHRERRDDAFCHAKYGKDWEEYRRQVPWRIFPGIY